MGQDIENSLQEPRAKVHHPMPKLSNKKFTKKKNSLSCPQAYRASNRWQKLPLDGATDFLLII